MKKVLSLLLVFTAFLFGLALNGQGVYAFDPGVDDYEDLFYETIEVNFEVLTWSDGSGTVTPGTFDVLNDSIVYDENNDSTNLVSIKLNNSTTSVNQLFVFQTVDRIDFTEPEIADKWFSLYENDTIGSSDMTPVIGDDWIVTLTITIPWTQSYSYGRVRSYDLDLDNQPGMTYDAANERVWVGFEDASDLDFDVRYFDFGDYSEFGIVAAWQSPYKNFRVVNALGTTTIEEWEDVAAVVFESQTNGEPDPRGSSTLTVYYWVDGEIVTDTLDDLDQERAYFYGGVRQAISTEENFVANVDDLVPLEDFLPFIMAWDDLLGDISDQVVIADDGGYQSDVVGVYDVVFSVTDSEDNESTLEASVHVVDIVAPVITGTSTPVTISYNADFNVAAWVASLTVSDNYYTGLTISVQSNSYSSNKTVLGTYSVTVKATDGSGNVGTLTRSITVVDQVGPVFTGMTTITASIAEELTVEQIKASLAAIDAKDGNVTSTIEVDSDELTGFNQVPGTYTVVFVAEDLVGNQTFHTVTVTITSAPPGIYVIDGSSVRLLPGATLTVEQILAVLGVTEGYSELSTDYQMNVPGVYQLSFMLNDELINIHITVLGVDDPVLPPPMIPVAQDFSWVIMLVGGLAVLAIGGLFASKKFKK